MLALSVRYLMGWAMATDPTDRSRPEWPPHPDRVFMALAAAYFEGGRPDAEREALTWLERQRPPSLWASEHAERSPVTAFVPVNDSALPRTRPGQAISRDAARRALELVPEHRPRQPRQFPVAVPRDPTMHLIWDADPPASVHGGLEALCRRVIRVGHSASLAAASLEGDPPAPNLVPREGSGRMRLRVPAPGRLEHLAEQHRRGLRPEHARWVGYGAPAPEPPARAAGSVFHSRMLLLRRTSGRELGLQSTLALTASLRDALMARCPQPVPEWLSGHAPGGGPSRDPHLAFLPLARTTGPRADGELLGVALAVPRRVSLAELAACLGPVIGPAPDGSGRRIRLYAGRLFEWELQVEEREASPAPLRSETWTRPSARWATVTPVAFDRHPKGRDRERQVERMVGRACERIGLPPPLAVAVTALTPHAGAGVPRRAWRPSCDGARPPPS